MDVIRMHSSPSDIVVQIETTKKTTHLDSYVWLPKRRRVATVFNADSLLIWNLHLRPGVTPEAELLEQRFCLTVWPPQSAVRRKITCPRYPQDALTVFLQDFLMTKIQQDAPLECCRGKIKINWDSDAQGRLCQVVIRAAGPELYSNENVTSVRRHIWKTSLWHVILRRVRWLC